MGEAEVYVGWKYVHCSIVGDNFFKFVHTDELIDNIAFFVLCSIYTAWQYSREGVRGYMSADFGPLSALKLRLNTMPHEKSKQVKIRYPMKIWHVCVWK